MTRFDLLDEYTTVAVPGGAPPRRSVRDAPSSDGSEAVVREYGNSLKATALAVCGLLILAIL